MKVLLVDNESTLIEKLQKLIPDKTVKINWDNLQNENPNKYNLIILSGSSSFPVDSNEERFSFEMGMVKSTNTPIIGICFGHEIIVKAFGGSLKKMEQRKKGLVQINVIEQHPIFNGVSSFTVYENHTFAANELGKHLTPLAMSDHGTAIVRHTTKMIYGFQFHPENYTKEAFGDDVFLSTYKLLLEK